MSGDIDPVYIPKIWKDMEKEVNKRVNKDNEEEKDGAAHPQGGR